jgi:hypothetical protein
MTTGFVERIKGKVLSSADSPTQMGKGGQLFKGGGTIYANSSSAGFGNTSDTNVDTLDSYSLPANSLQNSNYMLNIYAFGTLAANANSKTVTLSFGSGPETVFIADSVSVTGGSPWVLQMTVIKSASNQQVLSTMAALNGTHKGVAYTTGVETDTAAIPITVTGRSGTAAANNVVLNGWFIEANNF